MNLDGDLKADVDHAWSWDKSDWFAGERGLTTFELGFNLEEPSPYGIADITFINAQGNRPFPHQASDRGTLLEVRATQGLILGCDIFLEDFAAEDTCMRTALVAVARRLDGTPFYFEANIKDSIPALRDVIPYRWDGPESAGDERVFFDLSLNQWSHVAVDFGRWMVERGMGQRPIFWIYLVNECLKQWRTRDGDIATGSGSGHVKYQVRNFWFKA